AGRRPSLIPLGYGLFMHDGEVVLGPRVDPAGDPLLVLRAALVAARNQLPLAAATVANLAELSPALPSPWPPEALAIFCDLLAAGPGLVQVWEGLDLAGVVEMWIPQWAAVRSRPQRNLVHRHTVDRHLIETVVAAAGLVRHVARPDLLLLAALLHDIGKVAGSLDHSDTGARIVVSILDRMGLSSDDAAVVVRLVREHLTLMDLATRRDPSDPKTVEAVIEAAGGSADLLDQLAVLTEADAFAAGPLAWTDWRAQLFSRLVASARAHLRSGPDRVVEEPTAELSVLTPEMTARLSMGQPCVTVSSHGGVHRIDIVDRDRHGLFADTAGLLAAQGFVVRSALVRTIEGVAANEWHVESPGGDTPDPDGLARGLERLTGGDRTPLAPLSRRRRPAPIASARAGTGQPGQARALVLAHASDTATVIEVRATDRPGLLHDIGVTMARASLNVRSAHISTYAGQALDTFYLSEFGSRPLSPARVAQAVSMIIDTCETV
ncbi:MAG TPA: ACT domain-containing protein, partial [Candidatus Lustribacter sp.]|nr:ACT domain-containing protein [Candidatus Lustribacter sp.]